MLPSHINLKIGSLFFLTITFIIIFSLIYWKFFELSFSGAIYNSALIQTLNGTNSQFEKSSREKMVVSCQSILAYMITSGLLIVSFSTAR